MDTINKIKTKSSSDVAIYLYIDRTNSLIVLEEDLKDYWEAVDHCGIYWRNGISKGNALMFLSYGKWFIYDPEDEIGVEVA